ncbi:LytTR family DNA-binding domain-containing protein [Ferruginibacter sp. HRS2-29]|uniref:LytR/AlgR family response regulator transcription factor n=1 Tax=Ferruginibacter sp. HRS2-29 TaxID=2487334 RepID=UPI0020CC64DA|nr:LytTR family DNA-binding domain-containing protein [Ferruginibacter sp. HRS2-29]MCP9750946.1 DNA-binding response regulator [Ferruginibacter sp. HRS2-29]
MIKAVHIEDEPGNLKLLQELLKTHCATTIFMQGNARTLKDGVELIRKVKPELVFLDIELNQGNAFELLEQLKPISFEVIFITAFNEYAVRAFRANAVDYLLKPISTVELMEAVEKVQKKIRVQKGANEPVSNLMKELNEAFADKKISIPVAGGVMFIELLDIIRIEANGSYSILYLANGKTLTSSKNLKIFEQQLPEATFVRVHHSWIVNLKKMKKYYPGKNGYMEMEDGSKVMVSVRKKGKFLSFLPD